MLLGISLVFGMLIAWLAVTAIFIVIWSYRAVVGLREEDTLFIDPGEDRLLREQGVVVKKIERITPYFYGSLITSVLLGLATFGVWVYLELK
ncbi:MAG: hypothetical protein ACE5IP_10860 [Terriglobia bacterium]